MSESTIPAIEVTNLVKRYQRRDGKRVNAVDEISLVVEPGEFVVLLGPSGCGKTTLLRCIAGLEHPDSGRIDIHGVTQFDSSRRIAAPAERRPLSMVFQSYALWPHMSVFDNVAFPLRNRKVSRSEIKQRVGGALEKVGIPDLAASYPGHISGGQQQRVALARALVSGDGLILFDEPLSNVDARVRDDLRFELLEMQREIGFAALYVTHDQSEAMSMADRIAVLGGGRIQQLAPPEEVYFRPASRYVASFVGTTNEIAGKVVAALPGGQVQVDTSIGRMVATNAAGADFNPGDGVQVIWRPERVRVLQDAHEAPAVNSWRGRVDASMFVGAHREAVFDVGLKKIRVSSMGDRFPSRGDEATLCVATEDVLVLATGLRNAPAAGGGHRDGFAGGRTPHGGRDRPRI